MDNSLLVTTRKFLGLKSRSESVNLNDAAEILNVPKRRLYDITNVLEGIDIVEKIGKNSIRWKSARKYVLGNEDNNCVSKDRL
ncbi:unnamed protein product [Haemonchus placei]|uniref:E2F_TDP domain-containing protein n=1 Tax=Haemonchus placei TaxID=6290 RepID=A0A0N4W4M5_HAEPC|nr:unnamed protein product [Haemonchus placei]